LCRAARGGAGGISKRIEVDTERGQPRGARSRSNALPARSLIARGTACRVMYETC